MFRLIFTTQVVVSSATQYGRHRSLGGIASHGHTGYHTFKRFTPRDHQTMKAGILDEVGLLFHWEENAQQWANALNDNYVSQLQSINPSLDTIAAEKLLFPYIEKFLDRFKDRPERNYKTVVELHSYLQSCIEAIRVEAKRLDDFRHQKECARRPRAPAGRERGCKRSQTSQSDGSRRPASQPRTPLEVAEAVRVRVLGQLDNLLVPNHREKVWLSEYVMSLRYNFFEEKLCSLEHKCPKYTDWDNISDKKKEMILVEFLRRAFQAFPGGKVPGDNNRPMTMADLHKQYDDLIDKARDDTLDDM